MRSLTTLRLSSLLLCILIAFLSTEVAAERQTTNLKAIFASDFSEQISKVVNEPSITVFKTPVKGLALYSEDVKLYGRLKVGNGKIIADGLLSVHGSLTKSDRIVLHADRIESSHATFIVKSKNPSKPVLEVNDVVVVYHFSTENAYIESRTSMERAILPYNQVSLGFKSFIWSFDSQDLSFEGDRFRKLKIRSLNINHKGLAFDAESLRYQFQDREINVAGVKQIAVSNAQIVPDSGKLTIYEGAKIDTLRNAKILFNSENASHSLSTSDILIKSKEKFDGIATYSFETLAGDTLTLEFTNFQKSTRTVPHGQGSKQIVETIGEARITEEMQVEFMPGIYFKGRVLLSDFKKEIGLDGMIALKREGEENHWMKYNSLHEEKVNIHHKMMLPHSGKNLRTGIFIEESERTLFSSFVEPSLREGIPIFLAGGQLEYDKSKATYKLSKLQRTTGISKNQEFHYRHGSKEIDFDGVVSLGEASRYYQQRSAAVGTVFREKGEMRMNTLLIMDMKAPKKLFEHMVFTLNEHKLHHGARPPQKVFRSQLTHLLTPAEIEILRADKEKVVRLNQVFSNSITLTNLNLNWSAKEHAFYSAGKIGIGNLLNMNVDAKLNGLVYIPKLKSNHEIHVYFEVGDEWYYVKREVDTFSFRSSSASFNKMIKGRYKLLSQTEVDEVVDRHQRKDY